MTGLRRNLGLVALAAPVWLTLTTSTSAGSSPTVTGPAPTASSAPSVQDDLKATFQQAVELLQRGRKDEALAELQKVVAASPSQEAAYALWKETDYSAWRDLLVEGGQYELAAKRLIELARLGRKTHASDAAAIQPLVVIAVTDGDALARRKALLTLSADHGEYAVPYFLPYLSSDNGDEDRRVLAMHALSQMDSDVVVPLAKALASEDRDLRRNIAMVLGNIGDLRSGAVLLWLAAVDADETVRAVAQQSAQRIGARGDAVSALLALGDSYHHGRSEILGPRGPGDVVWRFADKTLTPEAVPPALYNEEMALDAYSRALQADPRSVAALAGLARSWMAEKSEIDALEKAGVDVSAWKARADAAQALVNSSGVSALDTALAWSVKSGDPISGAALADALGTLAPAPTPGLQAALSSGDGAMSAEAAVALGNIAARSGNIASPAVVHALAQATGREIQRIAAVIGDGEAVLAIADALRGKEVFVSHWTTGAKGASMVRRAAGLDLIVLTETLPDLTTAQVLDEIKADDRTKDVAVVLVAKDPAAAASLYGERIAGATSGASDMAPIEAVLAKDLDGDRARAQALAARAATALTLLAYRGGSDLSAATASLASAAARSDEVAIPAIRALGQIGGAGEVPALVQVLVDEQRSEDARAAAGDAIAAILSRAPTALDAATLSQVATVAASTAPARVREAASRAVGRAQMDPAARAEILQKLRG